METVGTPNLDKQSIIDRFQLDPIKKDEFQETFKICDLIIDFPSSGSLKDGLNAYSTKPFNIIYHQITESIFIGIIGDSKVGKSFILV
jgi:hypothetical protein